MNSKSLVNCFDWNLQYFEKFEEKIAPPPHHFTIMSLGPRVIRPFLLVKHLNRRIYIANFAIFCLTIYTCPKNPELSASMKLRDFWDRYCACPTISYFFLRSGVLTTACNVCVWCVCVQLRVVSCVCVSCMCVLASVCVRACVCIGNTNVLV